MFVYLAWTKTQTGGDDPSQQQLVVYKSTRDTVLRKSRGKAVFMKDNGFAVFRKPRQCFPQTKQKFTKIDLKTGQVKSLK